MSAKKRRYTTEEIKELSLQEIRRNRHDKGLASVYVGIAIGASAGLEAIGKLNRRDMHEWQKQAIDVSEILKYHTSVVR